MSAPSLSQPPDIDGYDITVHFEPLANVGDLYEFYQRQDGRL